MFPNSCRLSQDQHRQPGRVRRFFTHSRIHCKNRAESPRARPLFMLEAASRQFKRRSHRPPPVQKKRLSVLLGRKSSLTLRGSKLIVLHIRAEPQSHLSRELK